MWTPQCWVPLGCPCWGYRVKGTPRAPSLKSLKSFGFLFSGGKEDKRAKCQGLDEVRDTWDHADWYGASYGHLEAEGNIDQPPCAMSQLRRVHKFPAPQKVTVDRNFDDPAVFLGETEAYLVPQVNERTLLAKWVPTFHRLFTWLRRTEPWQEGNLRDTDSFGFQSPQTTPTKTLAGLFKGNPECPRANPDQA